MCYLDTFFNTRTCKKVVMLIVSYLVDNGTMSLENQMRIFYKKKNNNNFPPVNNFTQKKKIYILYIVIHSVKKTTTTKKTVWCIIKN